jgi:glycosyltransferase involved in cell wall biosynthesis
MKSPRAEEPIVSIILPCYNGAAYLPERLSLLKQFLAACGDPWDRAEVVLVDDGSTDDTARVAEATWPELRVIRLESNQGKGAAVRAGMLAAGGDFRFFLDADAPFELDVLPRMLDYLDRKEFDVVIGARNLEDALAHGRPGAWRRIASGVFTVFVSRIVVTGVHDTQCGLKGFREDMAEYLFGQQRTAGFAFDVELLYLAYKNNMDIKRVPVRLARGGTSTVSVLRHAPRMLVDVLKLPWRWYTGRYALMGEAR